MSTATANGVVDSGFDIDEYREELKAEAAEIIKAGLPLIVAEGKNPGGAMGDEWQLQKLSLEDAERLIDRQKHPAIGARLGPDGGAIDFDVDGSDELIALMELFDDDPSVLPTYTSGREGGEHRLAAFDPRLEAINKATVKYTTADGKHSITVRIGCGNKGAQSICPPSMHCEVQPKGSYNWHFTGKRYKWREGCDLESLGLTSLPDAVVKKLLAAGRSTKAGKHSAGAHAAGGDACEKALAAMLRVKVKDENDGSKRLYGCACRCVEFGLSDSEAVATIRRYAAEKPFPKDRTEGDILQRVRDAEEYVQRGIALELSNGHEYESEELDKEGNAKTKTAPLSMGEVIDGVKTATDNWPRRIGSALFIDDKQHGIGWFEKQASLFGWLRSKRTVTWHGGKKMVSREELFQELARTATAYDAVEVLPHEPPISSHYYSCATPPVTNGEALRALLRRFRPETTIDSNLILAAILTTFWGGPPGSRPAFVLTAKEGRGVGKTKLAEIIAYLAGGLIDISAGEEIGVLKQRFLSPEALTKRVALIDNIKSMRFSWAELESLITTPTISGKRLYVGEAVRPNTLTWILTLNGVSLATDMAQRAVIINLVRGKNDGTWYEDTIRFIDKNRQALIGDVLGALRTQRFPLHAYTRWAAWEKDVLCRLPEPEEAQKVILERQGEADCEQDEADLIEDFFADQLSRFSYDPETDQVRIQVATAAKWYCWATNEKCKTAAVTKRLKQMAEEGQAKRVSPDPSRTYGRCFIWTGEAADIHNEPISNDLQTRIEHYQKDR